MIDKISFLKDFAQSIGCVLVEEGEVGFGRPCVGILEENIGCYVDINPFDYTKETKTGEWDDCYFFDYQESMSPPPETPDAYHKHSCLAVLHHGDEGVEYTEAIDQLYFWVRSILNGGEVKLVKFNEKDYQSMSDFERIFCQPYNVTLVYEENK